MKIRKFAFLVHLRDYDDVMYVAPWLGFIMPFVRLLKRPILYFFSVIGGRLGFSVRAKFKFFFGGREVEGYILLIWLTGQQMMSLSQAHRVRKRVLEAALYAQNKLKCDVIGLGALTSSVTDSGEWLLRHPEVESAITHGDTYSVCVSAEGIRKVASIAGLNLSTATIAIVGATGLIGEGLTYQLASLMSKGLILIGRNSKKLDAVRQEAEKLGNKAIASLDLEDVKEADIVITATSWPKALIGPEHLKKGAIVYEVSQPRNVARSVLKTRPDITVVDGAFVSVPDGINFGWWMCHPPGRTFACMSETMMQAIEGDRQHHIGRIDPIFVGEVARRAKKYGFFHAPFTSFDKAISEEQLNGVVKIN